MGMRLDEAEIRVDAELPAKEERQGDRVGLYVTLVRVLPVSSAPKLSFVWCPSASSWALRSCSDDESACMRYSPDFADVGFNVSLCAPRSPGPVSGYIENEVILIVCFVLTSFRLPLEYVSSFSDVNTE